MKKHFLLISLLLCVAALRTFADEAKTIFVTTDNKALVLKVSGNGRLYQTYLGDKLNREAEYGNLGIQGEAYPCSGAEDYFEPAFAIKHNDGNMTSILKYVSHEVLNGSGQTETVVTLKDDQYPVEVKLHYVAYAKENVFKLWSEISHNEKKPVTISQYASGMLYFKAPNYYLTEFSGDWAKEVNISSQELRFGKKVIDTKLGTRAAMHVSPFFEIGLGEEVKETAGNVILGTIGWTGNFRFTFEVDNENILRIISGINPYASDYQLTPGTVFKTPEFIFTLSNNGTGEASRNFHRWARNYQLKDGKGDRMTLLNNWENTGFNFNQEILAGFMKEAKDLGVDMFLLDDGWFANKYPRSSDNAGLGDWDVTKEKLPDGVPFLVKAAEEAGVKFGIWIEPEMVNPKSELFEKHPDWAITLPNRETYYFRNQLVLDLSNPKVQDYVFDVVDRLMTENPDLAFFKWDCNSPITNIYSHYLKEKQSHLYIDYVRGLYNVLERVKAKYPNLPMMLCSGGGARCDYEALKYFTEFWASDNTDPIERLYIQWGFSQFFPAKAICAHVTGWNRNTSVKFRTDVAMMGKLGFDIGLKGMSKEELGYCREAVSNFHRLKPVILDGNQYRLVSPYGGNHTSTMYVKEDKQQAVVFAFDIYPRFGETLYAVKLQGLDPQKSYRIKEINLMPGRKSNLSCNDRTYSGDYLMKVGLNLFTTGKTQSRVVELIAE